MARGIKTMRKRKGTQDNIIHKYERQYTALFKLCKYVHKLTETLCPKIMQIYGNYFKVDSGPIRH